MTVLKTRHSSLCAHDVVSVKILRGDHLSRAIGRIAGKDGQTKFMIENATKTRIVLADKSVTPLGLRAVTLVWFRHVHILGSHSKIKVARDSICDLIMGSPAGKVLRLTIWTAL